jgi:WD40 repeat protein
MTRVISGRSDFFSAMSISPDERWLAIARHPSGLRIHDISTGAVHQTLAAGPKFVEFAGDQLYAVSYGGVARSWLLPEFSESDVRLRHGAGVRDVSISNDGKRLAMFGLDQHISLWDLESPAVLANPIKFHAGTDDGVGPIEGRIAISPDNKLLAIGLFKRTRIVDLETLSEKCVIPHGAKYAIAFSPDSQRLAMGTRVIDSTVYLYDVADAKLIASFDGHGSFIHDVTFSPDGGLIASASNDQTIRVWETESQTQLTVLRGHTDAVKCVAFTRGGERLMSGSLNGELYEWNPYRSEPGGWPLTVPSAVAAPNSSRYSRASFSPDGKYLAIRNRDDTVSLRSAETLEELRRLPQLGEDNRGIQFSPTEPLLAAGDGHGNLVILRLNGSDEIQNVHLLNDSEISPIRFTQDGKRLLVLARAQSQNQCIVCSMPDGQQTQRWDIPADDVSIAFSPNGELVVTEHEDRTTRIWMVNDPQTPIVRHHRDFGSGIAFSPDGKALVTTGQTAKVEIIDTNTFSPIGGLEGYTSHAATFSPDGKRVATGGPPIRVWDVATQQELMSLPVEGFYFDHVEFSPDGNAILAIGGSGDLHVWQVPSMEEIQASESRIGK